MKGQILANFLAEMSDVNPRELYGPSWLLETEGSSRAMKGGAGMILQSP